MLIVPKDGKKGEMEDLFDRKFPFHMILFVGDGVVELVLASEVVKSHLIVDTMKGCVLLVESQVEMLITPLEEF